MIYQCMIFFSNVAEIGLYHLHPIIKSKDYFDVLPFDSVFKGLMMICDDVKGQMSKVITARASDLLHLYRSRSIFRLSLKANTDTSNTLYFMIIIS